MGEPGKVRSVPPMPRQPDVNTSADLDDLSFPIATFTNARLDAQKRRLPQCIAHRGFRAKFPENTISAFRGAVDAGAHALETDVHLTKDDVVVLSHDATLKRCFGLPDKIVSKTWAEIKELRSLAEPHEPMPRLKDVLEYLAQPGLEEIWLLLDIKLDNDPDTVMRLIAETIEAAPQAQDTRWTNRIIMGIWAAKYLPLAKKYVSAFPVMHIGFSVPYARHFFQIPNVGFNMLLPMLVGPGGKRFLRDAREKYHRHVLAWTVNAEDKMEWCIRRKLDGVITDDPVLFLQVCRRHDEKEKDRFFSLNMKGYWDMCKIWVWIHVAFFFMKKRFLPVASREMVREGMKSSS